MKLCAAASTQHRKRKLHKNKLPLATGLYKPAGIFDKLDPFLPATLFQTGVKSRSLLSSVVPKDSENKLSPFNGFDLYRKGIVKAHPH